MKKVLFYFLIISIWVVSTTFHYDIYTPKNSSIDFAEIKKRGGIVVVTNYNTIDYFVYKGTPMGFQFEMLRDYAEYTGLQLEIIVKEDINEMTRMLNEGKCDIIAICLPVTAKYKQFLSFTETFFSAQQVLVQRSNDSENQKVFVKNIFDLNGKTIIVQKGSAYAERLRNLITETGVHFEIIEVPEGEEQLIRFVATGEIDYTVVNEMIAQVNKKYFNNIDVNLVLSLEQNLAWAVRKNSKELLESLNKFISVQKQTSKLAIYRTKYYQNQWASYMVNSDYFVLNSGNLSPYDDIIRQYSEELGWDWRLLAALIYHESKFNPQSKSHKGAVGLMQLLPTTAILFGADTVALHKPITNIAVGVKYLKWLDRKFIELVPDKEERIKFVLAAYNIGLGHIYDAQLLAKKYGKNMTRWEDVREFLLAKSQPQFYQDPEVKFGYCVGIQTYKYVTDVLNSYMHYKNLTAHR